MVATPLKGWRTNPAALAAVEVQHNTLKANNTWDPIPREWDDVCAEARLIGQTVHAGKVFIIVSVKGSELALDLQKVKARIVFNGGDVRTNFWSEVAQFDDLCSSPAAMAAYRLAVALGSGPGMTVQQADAEAAYLQADLVGVPTYVELPRELESAVGLGMRRPVHLLRKSLYGHPDSGTHWEKHLIVKLLNVGFTEVDGWDACFVHLSLIHI